MGSHNVACHREEVTVPPAFRVNATVAFSSKLTDVFCLWLFIFHPVFV